MSVGLCRFLSWFQFRDSYVGLHNNTVFCFFSYVMIRDCSSWIRKSRVYCTVRQQKRLGGEYWDGWPVFLPHQLTL